MPPLSREDLNRIEKLIHSFMSQLDRKNEADAFLWGTLVQSFPHFIIRATPNMGSRDVDQVYQSFGKNVAIISLMRKWPSDPDVEFYNDISKSLSVPLYWVYFSDDWNKFIVYDGCFRLQYEFNRDDFMKWSGLLSSNKLDVILHKFGKPKMKPDRGKKYIDLYTTVTAKEEFSAEE